MKTKLFLIILATLAISSVQAGIDEKAPAEIRAFAESDFGSIHFKSMKTHSIPMKILLTSLVIEGRARSYIAKDSYDFKEVFKYAGLTYPDKVIFGGKSYHFKSNDLPLGLVKKEVDFGINANVKFVNLSCTACHSGGQYNERGERLNNLVLGAASESFNPEVYVDLLYQGMKKIHQDWKGAMSIMNKLFPETSLREKILFQTFLKQQIKTYMKEHASYDRATTFKNGGPGLTNGISSLKNVLGIDAMAGSADGYTSIPSLAYREFRTSLLYDGLYSVAGKNGFTEIIRPTQENLVDAATVVSIFTVPAMGQTPKKAINSIPMVIKYIAPILKEYRTPVFPGTIDEKKAQAGQIIYQNNCMECHGNYEWSSGKKAVLTSFPNKLIPLSQINSDPERILAVDDGMIKKLASLNWDNQIKVNKTGGYVAPILEGLWASAPYLHNGSVPTLWHLLRPKTRPETFNSGAQDLDLKKVGLKNSKNKFSETYNTLLKGRSRTGHETEFNQLDENQKDELLEFLKVL